MTTSAAVEQAVDWTTWHLHLASSAPSVSDRVVLDVVAPVIRERDAPWFFLRYWHEGPHVRLRIGDLDADAAEATECELIERLALAGRLRADEPPLEADVYEDQAARFAPTESVGDVGTLRTPGVHRGPYVPELERYGGERMMPATEALFQLSSELVLGPLPHADDPRRRTMLALRATVAGAAALGGPDHRARYYAEGMQVWRRINALMGLDADTIDRLCAVGRPDGSALAAADHGPFARWHAALVDLAGELAVQGQDPGPIVLSHVHMFCNRLGRSLVDELQTYAWLAAAFPQREPGRD